MSALSAGVAADLDRDGAAVIRGALPAAWIERMRRAIDAEMAAGAPMGGALFPRVWPPAG